MLLTVKRRTRARNGVCPPPRILGLPDRPDAVELRVVEVKGRVAWAGKGIVRQTADDEVARGVEDGLRWRRVAGDLPAVGALFEAVDVSAAEEELDVGCLGLVGPEEVDVAGQGSGVVV